MRPDPVTATAEAVDDDLGGQRAVEAAYLQRSGPVRNHVSQVLVLRTVKHERGANLQGLGTLITDYEGDVTRLEDLIIKDLSLGNAYKHYFMLKRHLFCH